MRVLLFFQLLLLSPLFLNIFAEVFRFPRRILVLFFVQSINCFPEIFGFSLFLVHLRKLQMPYVEIKCQLDATEVFIADIIACSTCFGHHYAHHQELNSIIQWLLPVVFRAVVFKLLVWCGAEGYVSGLQAAGRSGNRILVETRYSALVQTVPGAHPVSYTKGTGYFPGVKRPRCGVNHPPHLAPRLKKE